MGKGDSDPNPKVVVVGGGIAGLMSAFHILQQMPKARVTILEKGNSIPYAFGTSTRSAACTRQQFGCQHNVEMSIFSTRFYERFAEITCCEHRMLWQVGYLFLYRDRQPCEAAHKRVKQQQSWGLQEVRSLSAEETIREYPHVVNNGLVGATFCPTDGFLDPNLILQTMRTKVTAMGGMIRTSSKVIGVHFSGDKAVSVILQDGDTIPCDILVNCSGAWTYQNSHLFETIVPIGPEKRYLWTAKFADPRMDVSDQQFAHIPMTVCMGTNGMVPYMKPEPSRGEHIFTIGCEHQVEPEWNFQDSDQDKVEPQFQPNLPGGYHEMIWEELVNWVSFAENFGFLPRVASGFYETTPDHNPFIDFDPHHPNVIHCAGFSGHGIMHGPAAGKMVADLLQYGEHRSFPSAGGNVSFAGLCAGTRQTEDMKI